ncbi:MAG TPA: class II aldolase/adducin family protein [Candidatus Dormibacteraeota bacterium]|nr:class II aldolase/adducin family protein [Candidatus Dormibacteraeota bacterium]
MTSPSDRSTARQQLLETIDGILRSGVLSMSGHGNVSLRIAGSDEILYTAAGSLASFPESAIARLDLDGRVLEGEVPPVAAAVIAMHTTIYHSRPETGCVIHTHSPYATAFAVAGRSIEGWTEGFGVFGIEGGVPVADYGPRGSERAIENIRAAMTPKSKAVLLANHGVLSWAPEAAAAVMVGVVVEEAAQAAIYASAIGGPKVVPHELLHASLERHQHFAEAGAKKPD